MARYNNPNGIWRDNPEYIKDVKNFKGCLAAVGIILAAIIVLLLLTGCGSIKYVPVETVRTEYINRTDTFIQKDSVLLKDSVFIHSKGDTVYFEKWHTKYKDRVITKIVTDSFIKRDTIQVPYPVEKKASAWDKTKLCAKGLLRGVITALILLFIFHIYTKKVK